MADGNVNVGTKKVEIVLRVGDREESILHMVWDPEVVNDLSVLHGMDGGAEVADIIARHVATSIAYEDGKAVKEAILRLIEHTRPPLKIHMEEDDGKSD